MARGRGSGEGKQGGESGIGIGEGKQGLLAKEGNRGGESGIESGEGVRVYKKTKGLWGRRRLKRTISFLTVAHLKSNDIPGGKKEGD